MSANDNMNSYCKFDLSYLQDESLIIDIYDKLFLASFYNKFDDYVELYDEFVNKYNLDKNKLVHDAIYTNKLEILIFLINNGNSIKNNNNYKLSILHSDFVIYDYLCKNNFITSKMKIICFDFALHCGNLDAIKLLCKEFGNDIYVKCDLDLCKNENKILCEKYNELNKQQSLFCKFQRNFMALRKIQQDLYERRKDPLCENCKNELCDKNHLILYDECDKCYDKYLYPLQRRYNNELGGKNYWSLCDKCNNCYDKHLYPLHKLNNNNDELLCDNGLCGKKYWILCDKCDKNIEKNKCWIAAYCKCDKCGLICPRQIVYSCDSISLSIAKLINKHFQYLFWDESVYGEYVCQNMKNKKKIFEYLIEMNCNGAMMLKNEIKEKINKNRSENHTIFRIAGTGYFT